MHRVKLHGGGERLGPVGEGDARNRALAVAATLRDDDLLGEY